METRLRIPVANLWFEPSRDEQRLLLAVRLAGTLTELHARFLGGIVVFRTVADIKERRVFEASEWHPADDRGQSLPGRLSLLSGPIRKEPLDVA